MSATQHDYIHLTWAWQSVQAGIGHTWSLLYVMVQLSRLIVVVLLFPGLAMSGYGLNWREATILVWSGLRGAVALSLALVVYVSICSLGVFDVSDATLTGWLTPALPTGRTDMCCSWHHHNYLELLLAPWAASALAALRAILGRRACSMRQIQTTCQR